MMHRFHLGHCLLLTFALLNTLTAAWPWPPSLRDLEGLILRRDDSSSSSGSVSATASGAKPSQTASSASQSGSAAATTKSGAKASGSGKSAAASSGAAATSGQAAASSVDPRLPPGGVSMITPSALATSTYYKIGIDSVSFAWNYTSLSVTPSKIDVLVSCSANQATYTLASNQAFDKTGSVVWDTRPDETGTAPLLTETYTLIIHDAAKAVTDTPVAGHLGDYNQFTFGMYIPQKYTPRADWVCATCSGALSDMDRQAIKFMLGMCAITVLSFTWFVAGFGGALA